MFTEEQKTLSQTVTVEQPTSFLTEQEIGDLSWMSVEYADEESGMTPGGLHIAVVSHTQVKKIFKNSYYHSFLASTFTFLIYYPV